MATAHLVTFVEHEAVRTFCGKTISVLDSSEMQPGTFGTVCSDCQKKIKESWVTFK